MPGEYGPMAFGAFGAETASRTSGGLGDLARAQAARAHANASGRAVDECLHPLQVRLEPAWTNIVGVRYRPADHRTLTADFAPFRHD
jgi:hypothetical protein